MEKGKKTNTTGSQLERTVQHVLINKGFKIVAHSKWKKTKNFTGKNYF